MQEYHKLVRDGIPEMIIAKGEECVFHIADEQEYWQKLKEKLLEEVREFCESESPEELADLYEVIDAIMEYKQIPEDVVIALQKTKQIKRGAFTKKLILEKS